MDNPTPKYYNYIFKGIKIDPYRILSLYQITHPALQHSIKKLLRLGRNQKSIEQDIDEVVASLNRWKEMIKEDNKS